MKNKLACLCCLVLILVCLLTACQDDRRAEPAEAGEENAAGRMEFSDFVDKRIGVMEGTIQEDMVREQFPEADISVYSSVADMPLALEAGVIDAFAGDSYIVSEILRNKPSLTALDTPIGYVEAAIAFPKTDKGRALRDQMNAFLKKCREDGSLEEMANLWFSDKVSETKVDMSGLPESGPVLEFATTGIAIPFSFFENGDVHGFDIDLAVRFCREYGYRINIETMSFPSIIPGLVSGRYNLAGNGIFVTEERKESIYFSDTYCALDIVLVTEKKGTQQASEGFFDTLGSSFEKTFIREERWKLIVQGIWTTAYISVSAAIFGTLLGFGLCMLRRMRNKTVHAITTIYIRILQGTPLVVLLMIMFYLIFADARISGERVAVITFALNFAAYACEIFRSGIEAVDKGQMEAALAIGFTRQGAFFKIIMPQAVTGILPVYQGEIISLIKMTSIVGYIAVQDLTKMSDIIRSRTYQAFFPLITTAVLYFLISGLFITILKAVRIRVEPQRTNRKIKGVEARHMQQS